MVVESACGHVSGGRLRTPRPPRPTSTYRAIHFLPQYVRLNAVVEVGSQVRSHLGLLLAAAFSDRPPVRVVFEVDVLPKESTKHRGACQRWDRMLRRAILPPARLGFSFRE